MSGTFNVDWEKTVRGVKEKLDDMYIYDNNIGPYYLTYYECPECTNSLLYKIKARGTVTYFHGSRVPIYNIFMCPACRRVLASPVNAMGQGKLSELALVSRRFSSNEQFIDKLNEGIDCMDYDWFISLVLVRKK